MKIIFFRTAATVALSIFAISTIGQIKSTDIAAAAQPVDVYAQLARTSSVRVSPDGQYVAMLSPYKGSKAIFVYDLANANAKPKVIPTPRNSIVKSVLWGSKTCPFAGAVTAFLPSRQATQTCRFALPLVCN